MKTYSSKSHECSEAIARHETFKTYGALSACRVEDANAQAIAFDYSGRLTGEDLKRFMQDRPNLAYVVRSYATPIAWVTKRGEVYRVKQKFSVTTSQHQGRCYMLER